MSEQSIHTATQATLKSIESFQNASIVINDWTVLDDSTQNAPYVIIQTADEFRSEQPTMSVKTRWDVYLNLIVRFEDDETTYNEVRRLRQTIIDEFNLVGGNRSAGGAENVTADVIRNGSDILGRYDRNIGNDPEADPLFLGQLIILEVREGF